MPLVTITLNKKNFQLTCDNGSEESLQKLANTVDQAMTLIKMSNTTASQELLLVMTTLNLQNQINILIEKLDQAPNVTRCSNDEDKNYATELHAISLYLDKLANKLSQV